MHEYFLQPNYPQTTNQETCYFDKLISVMYTCSELRSGTRRKNLTETDIHSVYFVKTFMKQFIVEVILVMNYKN